jgi:hypothetical protein
LSLFPLSQSIEFFGGRHFSVDARINFQRQNIIPGARSDTNSQSISDWSGGIGAEDINLQMIPMPGNSRTGIVGKNGCNEMINMLF